MRLLPLGDQAVMAYCDDEQAAARFAQRVRASRLPWIVDVVQAYTTVATFYDLGNMNFATAAQQLQQLPEGPDAQVADVARLVAIPCCYDLGLDWPRLEKHTSLRKTQIISLHAETVYAVYAIGFCPGFPYLGYLPEKLCGVPRLEAPRLRLDAGSVGLTGRQTGIYTEARPGGWNILGRTPLELVNVRDGYFPLRTGDRVQFQPIGKRGFNKLLGQRLPLCGTH